MYNIFYHFFVKNKIPLVMQYLRAVGFVLGWLLCCQPTLWAQFNTTLLGHIDYTQTVNDIWGYAANNREYALLGTRTGTAIIDVTDPVNPTELFFVSGPNSLWRNMKVWEHYAYVTNEADTGLHIIDLQYLPDSISSWNWTGGDFQGMPVTVLTAHTMYIDENGIGYIFGSNVGVGGAVMIDIAANPVNPPVVGIYNDRYIHDGYARGDTMWTSEIYAGRFAVVDVTDKASPVIMATQTTPSDFTHNCWLSDDGNTLFTTDEKPGAWITAYDVSDITDIKELGRYRRNPGTGIIPHNTYVVGNFLVTSYYRDGVTIADATYPSAIIETGQYDTSPLPSGSAFNGCWGVYPYLPSGNILASDMEEGLFIIQANYTPACHLQGVVSDATTGLPLPGAQVIIADSAASQTLTGFGGSFLTGIATAGSYTVQVSLYGYQTQTVEVTLQNGVLTPLNIALQPLPSFTLNLLITDALTGQPLPGAVVLLQSPIGTQNLTANALGQISAPLYAPETYQIYAGKWGYRTLFLQPFITPETANLTLPLTRGYYDDFFFDYGWTASGNALNGMWVRDVPTGTSFASQPSNAGADVDIDFGNQCFVTGNSGTGLADNVSEGTTILTSPVFDLTGYQNPQLSYYRYLSLQNGSNDTLKIQINNGIETKTIEIATDGNPYEYMFHQNTVSIADLLQPTANMQLIVTIADLPGTGHVVEAAFDMFEITEGIAPQVAFAVAGGASSGCSQLGVQYISTAPAGSLIQWVFPGGTPAESTDLNPWVTYNTPGTYAVIMVAANLFGFDELNSAGYITIYPQPDVTIAANTTVCIGSSISLTAQSDNTLTNWQWEGNGLLSTNAATVQALPNATGSQTYSVAVTDANGCTAANTTTIEALQLPQFTIAAATDTVCAGATFTLLATGAGSYTYSWQGNGEFNPLDPNSQTVETTAPPEQGLLNYTATAFDAATGCSAPPQNAAVAVAVTNPIEGIMAPIQVCQGQEIELSVVNQGEPSGGFVWRQNGIVLPFSTPTISILLTESATFTVQVYTNACVDSEIVDIVVYPPSPDIAIDAFGIIGSDVFVQNEVCSGNLLSLIADVSSGVAPFTYYWQGLGITNPTDSILEVILTDTIGYVNYTLTVTDANGCQTTQNNQVLVHPSDDCWSGIHNNQLTVVLLLAPNTTDDGSFTIQATLPATTQPVTLTVFNTLGQQIWKETFIHPNGLLNYHVQLPQSLPGLYLVCLEYGNSLYTRKLLCR
ncbi:hypothetical protein C7N43_30540 [Sphingobacteriales bacterium UPWRP_1]|nr:hypothetical protein C7N43_30540 [Sphingobacteriales bacterium UPWRP_1]